MKSNRFSPLHLSERVSDSIRVSLIHQVKDMRRNPRIFFCVSYLRDAAGVAATSPTRLISPRSMPRRATIHVQSPLLSGMRDRDPPQSPMAGECYEEDFFY